MKVFIAGASGVLGRRLIPRLVANGHEVVGMTRTGAKRSLLEGLGAAPVVADALDPEAVGKAVGESGAEVIVHQLTAIPDAIDMRRIDRDFALTNRLRTEGTNHLLSAAHATGVRRFVAQGFAPYVARGGGVRTEDAPLDPDPPRALRATVEALRHLETSVTGAEGMEGLVLRYGVFYGPGTGFAVEPPGANVRMILKRGFPVVGGGTGVWSLVHIEDAATATAVAVERGAPGVYHVVDDEPAPVSQWLPAFAEVVGAKPPRRVPRWLGRLLAGEAAVMMMTEVQGASNAKAKAELRWRPRYASWRRALAEGMG